MGNNLIMKNILIVNIYADYGGVIYADAHNYVAMINVSVYN
jgi:hypothetical protein